MNKKMLLAIAAAALLAVATLSACSSDYGTGSSLGKSGVMNYPSTLLNGNAASSSSTSSDSED